MSSSTAVPQEPNLLYTAVAKGKTILVSHANGTVNASSIASLILDRIDLATDSKQTFVHQKYQIHYIHTAKASTSPITAHEAPMQESGARDVGGGLTYLAIGTESLGRRIPFACLFDIQRRFLESFSASIIAHAGANEFQNEFEEVLRASMCAILSHGPSHAATSAGGAVAAAAAAGGGGARQGGDVARQVQREIDSVKDIMSQNIERVLERGERIDLLVDKSSHLGSSSLAFKKRSQAVKNQMWWQRTRTTALIGFVILFLVYLMVGIGCGLPLWNRCF